MNSKRSHRLMLAIHKLVTIIFMLACIQLDSRVAYSEALNELVPSQQNTSTQKHEEQTWYTCGMHPEVIDDNPGNCPKCGMKLVPMSRDRTEALGLVQSIGTEANPKDVGQKILYWKSPMDQGEMHDQPGKDSMGHDLVPVYSESGSKERVIGISPIVMQNMGIRTAVVEKGKVVRTVKTVGFVNYDETSLTAISTKVGGWIEKLYIEKTGEQVHQGDRLFELYSPELFSAQEGYLAARRGAKMGAGISPTFGKDSQSGSMVESARARLEYFDISSQQISKLEQIGRPQKTLTIYALSTGIVTQKNIVQGQMVKSGDDLFRIADLSSVWVIAKVYESDLAFIKVGQPALMSLNYLPGKMFRGRVTYIYPFLEDKTREISVRMEFHNPGYELKPGMFATVKLSSQLRENAILVPDIAVIDSGSRKVVFVTTAPGQFQLRDLTIGARSENNYLEVLSGLLAGDSVVISGQFLLDSESRLREAALKFLKPNVTQSDLKTNEKASKLDNSREGLAKEERTFFACPMPEHVDTIYEKAGKCPLCGMTLVPIPNPVSVQDQPSALEGEHSHDQ